MRPKILSLIFLLVIAISFAANCKGTSKILAPAIVQDGGKLIEISLQLIPGKGDVYLTIYPRTSVSTQISADDAVKYGFDAAKESWTNCDVLVKIEGKDIASYVEGPSAGIALSVLAYAAIKNKPILEDATITGGIEASGDIERVGGIYEKARVAAQENMKYFVIPLASVHEHVLLRPIKKNYGMEIIEVAHANEAIDFLVRGIPPPERELFTDSIDVPSDILNYTDPSVEPFKPLVLEMLNLESRWISKMPETTEEQRSIKDFYKKNIERQNLIFNKGYLFTSANEAFLDYIDITTIISGDDIENLDLNVQKARIGECLNSLTEKPKTKTNLEWMIGADLRKAWAEERLASIDASEAHLAEEKYFFFNQLQYADAWCFISEQMRELAPNGEDYIDEANFQSFAFSQLQKAESINATSKETQEHLTTARLLYDRGNYAASLYDSAFVISSQQTEDDFARFSSEKLDGRFRELLLANYTSLWARIYQAHAVYLAQGDPDDQMAAYRIIIYANNLNATYSGMPKTSLSTASEIINPLNIPLPSNPNKATNTQCTTAYIFGFIMSLSVIAWIRKQ